MNMTGQGVCERMQKKGEKVACPLFSSGERMHKKEKK
jgi:hypothetical protein